MARCKTVVPAVVAIHYSSSKHHTTQTSQLAMTMLRKMDHIDLWCDRLVLRILSDMVKLLRKAFTLATMRDRIASYSEVEAEEAIEEEETGVGVGQIVEEGEVDLKTEESAAAATLSHQDHNKIILNLQAPIHLVNINNRPKEETSTNSQSLHQPFRAFSCHPCHQQPTPLNNLKWHGLNSLPNSSKLSGMDRCLGNRLPDLQHKSHLLVERLSILLSFLDSGIRMDRMGRTAVLVDSDDWKMKL